MAEKETKAISSIYVPPLLSAASEYLHLNDSQLLNRAQINPKVLQKSLHFISQSQYISLLSEILSHTTTDHFITLLSDSIELTQHGLLGLLTLCGISMRSAIKALMRFYRMQAKVIYMDFIEENHLATIRISAATQLGIAEQFTLQMGIIALLKGKQQLVGTRDHSDEIHFTFSEEQSAALVSYCLPNHIKHNQPFNQIVFPASHLDLKIKSANQPTYDLLHSQCEHSLQSQTNNTAEKVKNILSQPAEGFPSIEQAASLLSVSPRTLCRQLKKSGHTYQQLLDHERITRAKEYLLYTDLTATDIAAQLYFSDASHFSKVFKRLTGKTPRTYRQSCQ